MNDILIASALMPAAIWLYLVLGHGGFWRADQRLEGEPAAGPSTWPAVTVIVPARNEEAVIGPCLASLTAQDYPGRLRIVLVDDHSTDATRGVAEAVAAGAEAGARMAIVGARPLPPGWSGKLWALAEGVRQAAELTPDAPWLLLTDADICHDPHSVRRLVGKAVGEERDLVSLMVLLDHRGLWAGLLIPAFVYFFQKLYPFPWVNDPGRSMAAAAGGCILVRRTMLERIGGIARIRGALIDDCTLAGAVKQAGGRLWLGLTRDLISLRPYTRFGEIWDMVARTAYTQLRYSPWLLVGTLAGLAATYLLAPLLVLTAPWHGSEAALAVALAAWGMMAGSYAPTLRLYAKPPMTAGLLPLVALLYSLMTLASALRHWRGRGGQWKGRVYQAAELVETDGGRATE
jgi:hopene-associated glycosyltransferase HpnB